MISNSLYITPHPDCYKYCPSQPPLNAGAANLVARVKPEGNSSGSQKKIICELWLNNFCKRKECGFSHSFDDLFAPPLPSNFKKNPCKNNFETGYCNFQFNCQFFHRGDYIHCDGEIVSVWAPDPLNPPYWVVYRIFKNA